MTRNGKSCTQNKEEHPGLRPHPKEGHQAEYAATSH